jgi:type IV pilus assembly protein PilW
MIHSNLKHFSSKQSGMSLIEVMVASTIGLIILIALGYFFLGSTQINRTTDDVSRMQESGRNALELMGRAIRQAGYRIRVNEAFGGDSKSSPNYGAKVVDGTFGAAAANAADNVADSITVKYDAQPGGDVDCTGADVAAGTTLKPNMVTATFAINSDGALTCNGTVVVENIQNMQISYVIDLGENLKKDGGADSVTTNPTADELKQVAAVQVTLLTRGPTANVATNRSQTLNYNGASKTYTDGFLRQVYSATFNVRNKSW